MVVVTTTKMLL